MEEVLVIRCLDILNNIFAFNHLDNCNRISRFLENVVYINNLTETKNLIILNEFINKNKKIFIEIDPAYLFNSALSNKIFVDLPKLDKHLKILINNKNSFLLMNFMREQLPHDEYIIPLLYTLQKYPELKNRILYITNLDINDELTRVSNLIGLSADGLICYNFNYFELDCYFNNIENNVTRSSNKEKLFLSLNTKPEKPNRLNMALYLNKYNLFNEGYFSLRKSYKYDASEAKQSIFDDLVDQFYSFSKKWDNLVIRQDLDEINNHIDRKGTWSGYPYPIELYNKSYISIIAETHFKFNRSVFLTEKTYRTIFYEHPFIMLGPPNSLTALRSLGYITFAPIINEEYDVEESDYKRLCSGLENLINNKKQIIERYNELLDISKHNKNILIKNSQKSISSIKNIFKGLR